MKELTVSIVVVSRGRPEALHRCLLGISQLFYHPFEVVVVADAQGCAAASQYARHIKLVTFDQANISAARNVGLDHAGGQIVAFIDDDAVPEPSWLDHLIAPFSRTSVDAAGGWVRGRNGISFQNQSRSVDPNGNQVSIVHPGPDPLVLQGSIQVAPRTEGTNMAWRRSVLADLGGFNAAYRYFLDETDLNVRLARHGGTTALVPLAQVHHGYSASARRRNDRVPTDLFDIGASWSVFFERYSENPIAALDAARAAEHARMIRYAVRGDVWPSAVRARLAEFDAGVADGRRYADAFWTPKGAPIFQPWFDTPPNRSSVAFASGLRHWRAAKRKVDHALTEKSRVTLYRFSPTTLFHQVEFTRAGYWLHTGGIWGRSDRDMPGSVTMDAPKPGGPRSG